MMLYWESRRIRKAIGAILVLIIVGIVSAVFLHRYSNHNRTNDSPDLRGKEHKMPPVAIAPFTAAEAKRLQAESALALGIPVEKEVALSPNVTIKLVWIPAGEFMMGSRDSAAQIAQEYKIGPEDLFKSEHPQHKVRLSKGFYIGAFEVTKGQYIALMNSRPAHWFPPFEPYTHESGNHPAVHVSWNDAMAFCRKLSQKVGKTFNLPSEVQWEYACRAGHKRGLALAIVIPICSDMVITVTGRV